MSNSLGKNLTLTVFGESHGEKVGAVVDGLPGGIKIDYGYIEECLSLRRPKGSCETSRHEPDNYKIVSGVFNGYTTGAPLTIEVENLNVRSMDYELTKNLPRPSHADYVAHVKYNGYEDYRGGGHFSGRITVAIVAVGAVILKALENKNIKIGSHIKQCGKIQDVSFTDFERQIDVVNKMDFPVISDVKAKMEEQISLMAKKGDSLGGIIETAIIGLPVGVGEPMFSSLEGELSKGLFSIGAIKGVSFGLGFSFADKSGSECNDCFKVENGKVVTTTNNNGGINGGISNGMPIVFSCVVKPTPSIAILQKTINIETMENKEIEIKGRHDPAIVRRINIVIRCISAFVIGDMLVEKYGNDFLK